MAKSEDKTTGEANWLSGQASDKSIRTGNIRKRLRMGDIAPTAAAMQNVLATDHGRGKCDANQLFISVTAMPTYDLPTSTILRRSRSTPARSKPATSAQPSSASSTASPTSLSKAMGQ